MDEEELLQWALAESDRLRPQNGPRLIHCTPALEFLDRYAGGNFARAAHEAIHQSFEDHHANAAVAAQLRNWAEFTRAGLARAEPYEVRSRLDAATDLMEQVQRLLDEPTFHAAAPVMLAGAALEELLRSMLVGCPESPIGKPGIATYTTALRKAGLVTAQDEKDITAWAGQRNEAAHGEFEKLSKARACLMVDGINLFMRQKVA